MTKWKFKNYIKCLPAPICHPSGAQPNQSSWFSFWNYQFLLNKFFSFVSYSLHKYGPKYFQNVYHKLWSYIMESWSQT